MIVGNPAGRFCASLRSARLHGAGIALAAALLLTSPTGTNAKTYLVNGDLSATPIGYGFKNLKKKLPSAKLFNNMIGGQSTIRREIVADIRRRHAANPDEGFTLAGISSGANVVLEVAHDLAKDGIQIYYLAIVESSGGSVPPNVLHADNFICAKAGFLCTRAPVAGATTIPVNTGHIDMGNSSVVHAHVIAMAR